MTKQDSEEVLLASDFIEGWKKDYYRYLVDGDPSNGLHPRAKAALILGIVELLQQQRGKYFEAVAKVKAKNATRHL